MKRTVFAMAEPPLFAPMLTTTKGAGLKTGYYEGMDVGAQSKLKLEGETASGSPVPLQPV